VVTAIANKEAEMVADAIFKDWFAKFGIPAQIHTDGGKEFVNKLSAETFGRAFPIAQRMPHKNVTGPSAMQCSSGSV